MRRLLLPLVAIVLLLSCSKQITIDDYVIVIPESASEAEQSGAAALQKYVKMISGSQLSIVSDASQPVAKEIVLGATSRELATELPTLGKDGFVIKTTADKIAIYGQGDKGTLYGVYEFLEGYLGCRLYSKDVEVVPQSSSVKVSAEIYDKQVPVIEYRYSSYKASRDSLFSDWHRLCDSKKDWGLWVHTFMSLVPPGEYFKEHPEYYALRSGKRSMTQLCLSNPEVLEVVCENLKERMALLPNASHWSVSQDDNQAYCQCDECKKLDDKDGGPIGSVITFTNKVAERFPDKTISTLAYLYSRAAPKVTKPRENVNIMFCNIECNRSRPIATDTLEAAFRKDMSDWAKLTKNILVWDYVIQFSNLVSPFPNMELLQPNMQYFVANNVTSMFPQGNREVGGEFADLRSYMIAKLMWNPDLDYNKVLQDFCYGYYGAAGSYIVEYIELMADELAASGDNMHIFGNPTSAVKSWLSPANMARYNEIFDKAEAAVVDDKGAAERVCYARQPLRYAAIEIAKLDPFSSNGIFEQRDGRWSARTEYIDQVKRFVDICNKEGVSRVYEWYITPDEYLELALSCAEVHITGNLAYGKEVTINVPLSGHNSQGVGIPVLTDGIYGGVDFAIQWLGFEVPEFEAVVDLGSVEGVSTIKSRYLQCLKDWLFHPAKVEFFTSVDGASYSKVAEVKCEPNPDIQVGGKEFAAEFAKRDARFVKVKTTTVGICPIWHGGSGNPCWTFIDEIVVN